MVLVDSKDIADSADLVDSSERCRSTNEGGLGGCLKAADLTTLVFYFVFRGALAFEIGFVDTLLTSLPEGLFNTSLLGVVSRFSLLLSLLLTLRNSGVLVESSSSSMQNGLYISIRLWVLGVIGGFLTLHLEVYPALGI